MGNEDDWWYIKGADYDLVVNRRKISYLKIKDLNILIGYDNNVLPEICSKTKEDVKAFIDWVCWPPPKQEDEG